MSRPFLRLGVAVRIIGVGSCGSSSNRRNSWRRRVTNTGRWIVGSRSHLVSVREELSIGAYGEDAFKAIMTDRFLDVA